MNHSHNHTLDNNGLDKIYICPMHPEIKQDQPGRCPECGMSLVPAKIKKAGQKDHETHDKSINIKTIDKHAGHSLKMFLRKFWFSLILTIPIILYSELPQKLFGLSLPEFYGSKYLALTLGSIIFFYGGWIFLVGAWRELRGRLPGMMTLIGLAISTAYIFSIASTFTGGHTLFWELATLITVMLLGHWFEMKAVQSTQSALKELSKLLPDKAEIIVGDKTKTIPIAELKVGDVVFVRPGSRIPSDGQVIEGLSEVDESMVSGESRPVKKQIGSEAIAGTINGDGFLKVKVSKIGENTFLAGVMRLVAQAQASKSRLQILSDKAAFYLTLIAIISGGITFGAWFLSRAGIGFALERLVAVLVIACPHALGLAVPLVASISTTLAAQSGFLVRQRPALEAARNIDIVVFDKTGTLTQGSFGVDKIIIFDKTKTEDEILLLSASLDSHSEHFIAKAIVEEANKRNLKLYSVKNFQRLPGKGVKGLVNDKEVFAGGETILKDLNLKIPQEPAKNILNLANQGKTIIYIIENKILLGVISLADLIRQESYEAVKSLKSMKVKTAMLTGDSQEVAKWVADQLGIDEYFAKILPREKAQKIKILQNKGLKVAMVGDGINDAPALTQADLGVAIGAGTNVAIESAGIILVKNDPRDIAKIIKLSRLTYKKMLQNLFWATGYNVVALPLAGGILAYKGVLLQPAVAALLMSFSTVIVAFNALFLRRAKI